jgi:hypothetical protein
MWYLVTWIVSWIVIGIALYRLYPRSGDRVSNPTLIAVGGGLILSLILIIIVTAIWPIQDAQQKAAAAADKAAESIQDACREDWHRCKNNAMLVNASKIYVNAVVACKDKADEQARYGHPDLPFLAFGQFYKGDSYLKSGVMILKEPDASFENGFGAMARVTVTCWYDMKNHAVVNMQIEPH